MKKIKILLTTKLSDKKLRDKLKTLVQSDLISSIEVVRATKGPVLNKITYYSLPSFTEKSLFLEMICLFVYLSFRMLINRPDCLIGIYYVPYGLFMQFYGKLFRIPVINNLIGADVLLYYSKPTIWKILRKIMKKSRCLTTTGYQTRRLLLKDGFLPEQLFVLPNPIDSSEYFPKDAEMVYDIISVSNLIKTKGIDLTLKALVEVKKKFPNVLFAIVGDGPERTNLENLAKELALDDSVIFLGHRKDISQLLDKSKVFIISSNREGLPVSLMEAMASARPVIATDVGDSQDVIVNYQNGILIPKNNVAEIEKALIFLLENPKRAFEIGRNALSILSTNSVENVTNIWSTLLGKL